MHHSHSLVNTVALDIVCLLAKGLRGDFIQSCAGLDVLRYRLYAAIDLHMNEYRVCECPMN